MNLRRCIRENRLVLKAGSTGILLILLVFAAMKNSLAAQDITLPLFNPHRPDFTCQIEAEKVPPIDAQAEAWFQEALALDDPNIYVGDRDQKTILRLTRQAAERHHWKAMLNLASMYLENLDSAKGVADALALVREAMRLGIPAAFDRMGTYYLNGVGVSGASEGFALIQRAAEMGHPQSMTFLGGKMSATWDSPDDGFWANIPIATKMLECAMAQGDGFAAMHLYYIYQHQKRPGASQRALKALHEGVKLGCGECAIRLAIEFGAPFAPADTFAPFIDKARAERYRIFGRALNFNPRRRYPNLDQILPLPPVALPPWNGDKDMLLDAAKGVAPAPKVAPRHAASERSGRHFLAAEFTLRPTGLSSSAPRVPVPGYWQPVTSHNARKSHILDTVPPAFYAANEPFATFRPTTGDQANETEELVWSRFDTIKWNYADVDPTALAGITRQIPAPASHDACATMSPCPTTGIWQPWIDPDNLMSAIVNQSWRQAWLAQGQAFPHPQHDWLLPLAADTVKWHLMEQCGTDDLT